MQERLRMIDIIKWSLIFLGTMVVVAVSIPLLGAAIFFGRFVLIAAVPLAIAAVLLSPGLRMRLSLEGEGSS